MNRSCFFKSTKDDWYGSYKVYKWPIRLVEITVYRYQDEFVITAMGTDDYSLMKRTKDEPIYQADLMKILSMQSVDRDRLVAMGFELSC